MSFEAIDNDARRRNDHNSSPYGELQRYRNNEKQNNYMHNFAQVILLWLNPLNECKSHLIAAKWPIGM